MNMVSKYKKQLFSGIGLVRFLITGLFVLSSLSGFAQFTINENFKGSKYADIQTGDGAYFTSGIDDPVNQGWLRLTKNLNNQKGFAYINKAFPSTLGVLIDFEYLMWKDINEGQGADGIGIFLFDAKYGPTAGPNQFKLGAYGGSLGYAPIVVGGETYGLTGGYVGIGLDAYGNFARIGEGQIKTGTTIEKPNAVVLRGPSTNNFTNAVVNGVQPSNRFLKGVTLKNNAVYDIFSETGVKSENEIDYNTSTATRPKEGTFYRRVQVEIIPIPGNLYKITIRWKKSPGGSFTELISYNTQDVPPALLKIGFAASTGGDKNYHEIRNLMVTTPGNLRVAKRADKDVLRTVSGTNPTNQNDVTYTIDVVNDTNGPLTGIDFSDKVTDGLGNLVPTSMFNITSITSTGFSSGTVLPSTSATNEFTGKLNMAANSTGIITVKGTLKQMPVGNVLTNTTSAFANDILDEDLGNNTAIVNTPVLSEEADVIVNSTVDNSCLDLTNGNNYSFTVSNIGSLDVAYGGETVTKLSNGATSGNFTRNRVQLKVTIPIGFTPVNNTAGTTWQYVTVQRSADNLSNIYTFITRVNSVEANNTSTTESTPEVLLRSGGIMLPITLNVKKDLGLPANLLIKSEVSWIQETGTVSRSLAVSPWNYGTASSTVLEIPANILNNTSQTNVAVKPVAPVVASNVYYCLGETSVPLTATAASGNSLVWYLSASGGVPSSTPFRPNTATAGVTSYYVSQTNGNCESPIVEIKVTVLAAPTTGSISTTQNVLCIGAAPTQLTGVAGTGATGTTISYRWEKSEDNGASWSVVAGETGVSYAPASLSRTTSFRRVTLATIGGKTCESAATAVLKFTVKNCTVISNPMLPSKARNN